VTADKPTAALPVDYFSDVLCIWAYAAEARVEELARKLGDRVAISRRYLSVFGDTATRIGVGWRERGGWEAFNAHVRSVAANFDHVAVHPRLWLDARPASSLGVHLLLKAAALALPEAAERLDWALRLAFFRDGRDIADAAVQREVAAAEGLAWAPLRRAIDDGSAFAALSGDLEACEKMRIEGSPTFVLNEGRQKLYGNVGYRVIEANVQELLRAPSRDQASWC